MINGRVSTIEDEPGRYPKTGSVGRGKEALVQIFLEQNVADWSGNRNICTDTRRFSAVDRAIPASCGCGGRLCKREPAARSALFNGH